MKDLEGWKDDYELNSRVVKRDGRIEEEVYKVGGRYDAQLRDIVIASQGGDSVRHRSHGEGAARVDQVVRDGRDGRPPGIRHRVGAGQGFSRRYHQRVYRGVSGCAWPERRVGSRRLLREPRQDVRHSENRRQRAVVRRPDAVGPGVPEAGRAGHHGERHRYRRRDGRFRSGHAHRHQSAERSGHSREVRQQVGVVVQHQHRVRRRDGPGFPHGVFLEPGGGGALGEVRRLCQRAHHGSP